MSPRPTKSIGNRSRSPKISTSTSTYFGDAMLPSSTTPQLAGDNKKTRACGTITEDTRDTQPGLKLGRAQNDELHHQVQHNERHERHRDNSANDADDEEPVAARRRLHLRRVPLEQRQILRVRLPEKIGGVADDGHDTDEHVDPDIEEHPDLHAARAAQPMRLDDDRRPEDRRQHIADPGDQPDDRIPSEAEVGAGDAKRLVEEAHELSDRVEAAIRVQRSSPRQRPWRMQR